MRKIILLLLVIATLFVSSGQSYEQQSLIPTLEKWLPSKPLEAPLSKLEIPYWGKTISVEERGYYYFVEFLMRKSAHFLIFGVLATIIYWIIPAARPKRMLIAFLLTTAFAIADEYHQSLTGGRTPSRKDVLLDMSGAATFLFLIQIFPHKKIKKKPIKSNK